MRTKKIKLILLAITMITIAFSCKKNQDKEVNSIAEIKTLESTAPSNQMNFPEVTLVTGEIYEFFTRSTVPSEDGIFENAIKMTIVLDENGVLNVDREEIIVGENTAAELPQVHFLTETNLELLQDGSQKVDHVRADPQADNVAYIPFSINDMQPVFYRKSGETKAVCKCIQFNIPPGQAGGNCTPEGRFCIQTCYNCEVSFVKVHQTYAGRSVVVYTGPGSTIESISINS